MKKKTFLIGIIFLVMVVIIAVALAQNIYEDKTKDETANVNNNEQEAEISEEAEENLEESDDEYTLIPGRYEIEGYVDFSNNTDSEIKLGCFCIDEYGNMSAGWSALSSHLIFGWYSIEDDVLTLHDECGDEFRFKIIENDKVSVMINESSEFVSYGEEYKIKDGDIFNYVGECDPIVTDLEGNPVSNN